MHAHSRVLRLADLDGISLPPTAPFRAVGRDPILDGRQACLAAVRLSHRRGSGGSGPALLSGGPKRVSPQRGEDPLGRCILRPRTGLSTIGGFRGRTGYRRSAVFAAMHKRYPRPPGRTIHIFALSLCMTRMANRLGKITFFPAASWPNGCHRHDYGPQLATAIWRGKFHGLENL